MTPGGSKQDRTTIWDVITKRGPLHKHQYSDLIHVLNPGIVSGFFELGIISG